MEVAYDAGYWLATQAVGAATQAAGFVRHATHRTVHIACNAGNRLLSAGHSLATPLKGGAAQAVGAVQNAAPAQTPAPAAGFVRHAKHRTVDTVRNAGKRLLAAADFVATQVVGAAAQAVGAVQSAGDSVATLAVDAAAQAVGAVQSAGDSVATLAVDAAAQAVGAVQSAGDSVAAEVQNAVVSAVESTAEIPHDTNNWLLSLERFVSVLWIYAVIKGVPLQAISLLPVFPILFIPNRILLAVDKFIKLVMSPIFGASSSARRTMAELCVTHPWPRAGRPPVVGCEYSNVNLAFGAYEYNVPDDTGKSFVDQQPTQGWHIDAARFLCALSKIIYEEFIDFEVCQALLRLLNGVDAQLVAGFQFLRIKYKTGRDNLQSLQVGIIKVSRRGSAQPAALVVAFWGSEPFVQADWFMDFDFILEDKELAPCGDTHPGFRMGLGMNVKLDADLPGLTTQYRGYTSYPGQGPRVVRTPEWTPTTPGGSPASGYSLLVDALRAATSGLDADVVKKLPIYVTGHSLGGGMAHMFAVALSLRNPELKHRLALVYTYAQPRIGDERFVKKSNELLEGKHYRVVNAIDIVPRVPPLRDTWVPKRMFKPYPFLEKWLLGRKIIEYHHAGKARLCEKIIQLPATVPMDHTIAPDEYRDWLGHPLVPDNAPNEAEPPATTVLRWLYFGLGKLGWGAVSCLALGPMHVVWRASGRSPLDLPLWAQTPVETLPRLAVRIIPFVWAISDHFVGGYCNMFYWPIQHFN